MNKIGLLLLRYERNEGESTLAKGAAEEGMPIQ
jgi:hypothetical protein